MVYPREIIACRKLYSRHFDKVQGYDAVFAAREAHKEPFGRLVLTDKSNRLFREGWHFELGKS